MSSEVSVLGQYVLGSMCPGGKGTWGIYILKVSFWGCGGGGGGGRNRGFRGMPPSLGQILIIKMLNS